MPDLAVNVLQSRGRRQVGTVAMNGRILLQSSDLTYDGAFRIPQVGAPYDTSAVRGLMVRRIGGVTKVFTTDVTQGLHEFAVPSPLGQGHPVTTDATLTSLGVIKDVTDTLKFWGDNVGGTNIGGHMSLYGGLVWDETTQRFYGSSGRSYSGNPCDSTIHLGYFNDGASPRTPIAVGSWRVPHYTAGSKVMGTRMMCSPTIIPEWFATAYTGGRRIGVGCGGNVSNETLACHRGLGLVAISEPDPDLMAPADQVNASYTEGGGPPNDALFDAMWTDYVALSLRPVGEPGVTPIPRNVNYYNATGWNPSGGVGYMTFVDETPFSCVWVDTGTKHGVLMFGDQCWVEGNATAHVVSFTAPIGGENGTQTVTLDAVIPDMTHLGIFGLEITVHGVATCTALSVSPDGLTVTYSQYSYWGEGGEPYAGGHCYRGAWYTGSNAWVSESKRVVHCYDPADLALVAQGQKDPYTVDPAWEYVFPDGEDAFFALDPPRHYGGGGGVTCGMRGIAWEPTTQKIYILVAGTTYGSYPAYGASDRSYVVALSVA